MRSPFILLPLIISSKKYSSLQYLSMKVITPQRKLASSHTGKANQNKTWGH